MRRSDKRYPENSTLTYTKSPSGERSGHHPLKERVSDFYKKVPLDNRTIYPGQEDPKNPHKCQFKKNKDLGLQDW